MDARQKNTALFDIRLLNKQENATIEMRKNESILLCAILELLYTVKNMDICPHRSFKN